MHVFTRSQESFSSVFGYECLQKSCFSYVLSEKKYETRLHLGNLNPLSQMKEEERHDTAILIIPLIYWQRR